MLHIHGLPAPGMPTCMSPSQRIKPDFLLAPHVNALLSNWNILFQVELEPDEMNLERGVFAPDQQHLHRE